MSVAMSLYNIKYATVYIGGTFSIVTSCHSGRRKSIVEASELQFSDGLYAEVLFLRVSVPIARRGIVLLCSESY